MRFRIGTSGYSYKEWKGSFYPADQSADGMLRYYAERFPTVEINNSFYRMPTESVVAGWADQVPDAFSFVLKAPQRITHQLRLKATDETTQRFLQVAAELGKKQGPLLFQLPPNFKKDLPRLVDFLATLPRTVRVAFEFRNDSWFEDAVYAALRDHGAALCVAETEKGRTPLVSTVGWGYLRLRDAEYDDAELAAWAKELRAQPWEDTYIFFKHEDEGKGPKMAARLMAVLAEP